jgi:large subunit ribosomal protein L6
MSRIGKMPVNLPQGVEVTRNGRSVAVKGGKGLLEHSLHELVEVEIGEGELTVKPVSDSQQARALYGTTRAILQNMVTGVSAGFERKLEIVGVGYRAQVQGNKLNLSLGYSHPVEFQIPDGISIETPTQTEILVRGNDKQQVGQVAANIRAFRKPEPYKGKGVRYSGEHIVKKEAKKN